MTLERAWWLRALLVLQAPTAVFTALRDDSDEAADARQEPILAIVLLGSFSAVLGTTIAGHLYDDPEFDPLLVVVWAIVGAVIYAAASYFLLGALLHFSVRLAGGDGSFRRARHLLGYAAAPLALSLAVWPLRIAVYGSDLFRRGGSDQGVGNAVFEALETAFLVWTVALVVVGVRAVHGWSWLRALVASAPVAAVPAFALARAHGVV